MSDLPPRRPEIEPIEPPEADDDLDLLEHGNLLERPLLPALVVLPDPEAQLDIERPVMGRVPLQRLAAAARTAGFGAIVLAPGTRLSVDDAKELATGDRLRRPALVVYEGSCVHPRLLSLMVEHPLEDDERYSIYDEVGRPVACFVGHLGHVPPTMPMSEELPWPEGMGPKDAVRLIYDEDLARAERVVLRSEDVLDIEPSWWRRHVSFPALRWMANSGRPVPQLELLSLVFALGSLPLALLGTHFGIVLATWSLVFGVHMAALLPKIKGLRPDRALDAVMAVSIVSGDALSRSVRPLGQAALMGGLTYAIVAETNRSGVAATVLLAAGGAAVLLCLFQARLLLRNRPADVFALPDARAVTVRLGLRWPPALDGAPVLELAAAIAALPGIYELPWSVLAAAAVARLWRWFVTGALPLGLDDRLAGVPSEPPVPPSAPPSTVAEADRRG